MSYEFLARIRQSDQGSVLDGSTYGGSEAESICAPIGSSVVPLCLAPNANVFKYVGHAVNSLFRIRERVKNNRANYSHETNLTEIVSSMCSDTEQGPLHAIGAKHSNDSGPAAAATPAHNHIETLTPKTVPAGMLTP